MGGGKDALLTEMERKADLVADRGKRTTDPCFVADLSSQAGELKKRNAPSWINGKNDVDRPDSRNNSRLRNCLSPKKKRPPNAGSKLAKEGLVYNDEREKMNLKAERNEVAVDGDCWKRKKKMPDRRRSGPQIPPPPGRSKEGDPDSYNQRRGIREGKRVPNDEISTSVRPLHQSILGKTITKLPKYECRNLEGR